MEFLEIIKGKILPWNLIDKRVAMWRFLDKKIVFTNGCFDILHLGHIEYLAKARSMGNLLIIGLNSDASIHKIKGPDRPVNDENSRAMVLASLSFVDAVILFDEETPAELIRRINPDILVKGNDYRADQIAGHDIVEAHGGKVVTIELTPGYSTTGIISRINHPEKH
ncbi:MAG: D-glycero-beta-D-manno-heptose 1-phosphate adenylyltransferase [Bacteroidota bacterium]|nr:D-glycero-beta-D-manno-heptose 1-phosphate adenylyltransferase [Bacteroidota bacterium]